MIHRIGHGARSTTTPPRRGKEAKVKKFILSIIAVLLAAVPAFAAKVEWKVTPATDDEKAVAKVFEGYAQAYGQAEMGQYLTADVVHWALPVSTIAAGQPKYEGAAVVALLASGTTSRHEFFNLAVKVSDGKAEVTGRHYFTIFFRGIAIDIRVAPVWKLRREADGSWKIYESDYRNRL